MYVCVLQVLRVVVEDRPDSGAVPLIPSVDYSCMGVAFCTLYCGGYQGKANGDVMVTCLNHKCMHFADGITFSAHITFYGHEV